MRPVLVLRPEPGASFTVDQARRLGLQAIAVPLFAIEAVPWNTPDPRGFDGLLITSVNALRHAGPQLNALRALPVYAVGEATAMAARFTGLHIAAAGEEGVDWLLGSIEPDLNLLHLCGADRREPENAEQRILPVVVYRSSETESPDLSGIEGSVALIHSPRAGRRFAELVKDRSGMAVVAISAAAAEAVGTGWEEVAVAAEPTDDALLALAARLCNKSQPK